MQSNDSSQPIEAKPMKVGENPGETQQLADKIENSGAVESLDAAATKPGPGPDSTEDAAPTIPLPVVPRNG